jgi:hypothetical protein
MKVELGIVAEASHVQQPNRQSSSPVIWRLLFLANDSLLCRERMADSKLENSRESDTPLAV